MVVVPTLVRSHPVGGREYPRTLSEFRAWFPDEEACFRYLATIRWPEGFVCPSCGSGEGWWLGRTRKLRCARCRRDVSITAGTIFADSHLSLETWFAAAWHVTSQKPGVSALSLQRVLGLGSYRTAWALLHKLRRAMVRPVRDLLGCEVEVDETYLGGPAAGKRGRGALGKAIVAIAVEVVPTGGRSKRPATGRVRLARIPDCSQGSLEGFCQDVLEPGTVIYTDFWSGYAGLDGLGFVHHPTNISASGDPAHVAMPRVHRVASLLKRWLLGTHQGGVSVRQLDFYLDEFTFRFNRRSSRHRGLLFYRLLEQAIDIEPVRAREIIGGRP